MHSLGPGRARRVWRASERFALFLFSFYAKHLLDRERRWLVARIAQGGAPLD